MLKVFANFVLQYRHIKTEESNDQKYDCHHQSQKQNSLYDQIGQDQQRYGNNVGDTRIDRRTNCFPYWFAQLWSKDIRRQPSIVPQRYPSQAPKARSCVCFGKPASDPPGCPRAPPTRHSDQEQLSRYIEVLFVQKRDQRLLMLFFILHQPVRPGSHLSVVYKLHWLFPDSRAAVTKV